MVESGKSHLLRSLNKMRFENTSVYNIYNAILGARNPMNSWDKSDSVFNGFNGKIENTVIGKNDLELMQKLIKAGSEHRKFLRQIFVSVDITAPLYWWKEFDTYKVGTVSNSTSTMHKLASTPITIDCFEMDDFEKINLESQDIVFPLETTWKSLISDLEFCRQKYNKVMENKKHLEEIQEYEEAKKAQVMAKKYWKELIRLLPESWLQKRTITMNYENILNMYRHRKNHKLTEWSKSFIDWVKTLPYAEELICFE